MTRTKARKPRINCNAYDDYYDHNDFLDDSHHSELDDTVACSHSHTHVSTKAGGDDSLDCNNEQEKEVQTNDQPSSTDGAQAHTAANANANANANNGASDNTNSTANNGASDNTNSNADVDLDVDLDVEMITKTPPAPIAYVNVTPKMNHNNEEEASDDFVSIYTADMDNITINEDDATADHLELDFCTVQVNEEETKTDTNAAAAAAVHNNHDEQSGYIVDDWDVLSIMQHLKDQDASYVDWDAISSVQSVVSMETFQTHATTTKTLTYKDILANRKVEKKSKSLNNNTDTTNNKKPSSKIQGVIILPSLSFSVEDREQECKKYDSSLMLPILEKDEECSSFPFDAYHELEGYKYSRGGKRPYQFRRKKNQNQKQKMTCRFSIA